MDAETKRVLKMYQERKLTRPRAAKLLGVSGRQVNRLMERAELERDPAKYVVRMNVAEAKRAERLELAKRAKAGKLTPALAAKRAGCSERTIYRYMDQL